MNNFLQFRLTFTTARTNGRFAMRGRIILQDLVSNRYLTPGGDWALNCQDGRTFEHTYMALLEGLEYHDKPTQVVWCFGNPGANFYLPVHPSDSDKVHLCMSCPLLGIQPPNEQLETVFASSFLGSASNVNADQEAQNEQYRAKSVHR